MKHYLLLSLIFLGFFVPALHCQENRIDVEKYPEIKNENDSFKIYNRYPLSGENHPSLEGDDTPSYESKFIRMLVILALLIAFMLIASWALKHMMRSRLTQLNTESQIKLIESRSLSSKCILHLLEVEGKHFLIAESPTKVISMQPIKMEVRPESE